MDNIIGLKHDIPTDNPPAGSLNAWLLAQGINPATGYTTQLNAQWLVGLMQALQPVKSVSRTKDLIANLQDHNRRNTTAWEVLILVKAGYTVGVHDTDKLLFTPPAAPPVIAGELQQIINNGIAALASQDPRQWQNFWDNWRSNYRQFVLNIYTSAMPMAAPQLVEHGRA